MGNAFSKSTKSLLFGFFEFIWARPTPKRILFLPFLSTTLSTNKQSYMLKIIFHETKSICSRTLNYRMILIIRSPYMYYRGKNEERELGRHYMQFSSSKSTCRYATKVEVPRSRII